MIKGEYLLFDKVDTPETVAHDLMVYYTEDDIERIIEAFEKEKSK